MAAYTAPGQTGGTVLTLGRRRAQALRRDLFFSAARPYSTARKQEVAPGLYDCVTGDFLTRPRREPFLSFFFLWEETLSPKSFLPRPLSDGATIGKRREAVVVFNDGNDGGRARERFAKARPGCKKSPMALRAGRVPCSSVRPLSPSPLLVAPFGGQEPLRAQRFLLSGRSGTEAVPECRKALKIMRYYYIPPNKEDI